MQQRERGEHNLLLIGYYRLDKISSSVMVRDGDWKLDLCGENRAHPYSGTCLTGALNHFLKGQSKLAFAKTTAKKRQKCKSGKALSLFGLV